MLRNTLSFFCLVVLCIALSQAQPGPAVPLPEAAVPLQLHAAPAATIKGTVPKKERPTNLDDPNDAQSAKGYVSTALIDGVSPLQPALPPTDPPSEGPPAAADSSNVATTASSQLPAADDASLLTVPAVMAAPDEQVATSPTTPMGSVVSGAEAVSRLGPNIAAVARAYGQEPEELTRALLSDADLKLDSGNALLYRFV